MYIIFLLILLFIPIVISLFYHGMVLNVYAVIIFILSIFILCLKEKKFSILIFYIYMAFISTLLISLVVEQGVFLIEILETSYSTGVTYKAAFSALSFIAIALFTFKKSLGFNLVVRSFDSFSTKLIENGVRSIILLCSLTVLSLLIIYGFPIFINVHRVNFWYYHAVPWGYTLVTWLIQFLFMLGFMYAVNKNKKDLYLFIFSLVICVLAGTRFSGIMIALLYFFTPSLLLSDKFKFYNVKFLLVVPLILILSLFVVQNTMGGDSKIEQQQNLVGRIVLQSQMWWALDRESSWEPQSGELILKSYLGIGNDDIKEKDINYLMYLVAPSYIVDEKVETGSTFTSSNLFNNYYFFGYFFGYFVNLLWGAIFGVCIYLTYLGIQFKNNVLYSFFAFKLMLKFQVVFLTANTSDIFSWIVALSLLVIISILSVRTQKM